MPVVPVDESAAEPAPVEPLPVEPIPVETIDAYPYAGQFRRPGPPGLVTAIGTLSIVVAGISLIGGPVTTLAMAAIVAAQSARANFATMAVAPRPAVVGLAAVEVVDENGYGAADRAAVIEGLARSRAITPEQREQLDELLAESGRTIVSVGTPVDPSLVSASVSSTGQLTEYGATASDGEHAPSYFVLANGRLEVTDTRAVFFPGDGQPAVRAVAFPLPAVSAGFTPGPLTDDAIRSTLRSIVRLNGGRPKSVQIKAAVDMLRGPGEQIVVPTTDGTDPAAEVTAATTDPSGTLTIDTSHGSSTCEWTVTADGQTNASISSTATAIAPPPVSKATLGFTVSLAIPEFAAAVYLLVIGILTARRSRFGRRLHWIYVGVKLPLSVAAIVAAGYVGAKVSGGSGTGWWLVPAGLGAVYPLSLVRALMAKSVRAFYGPGDVTSAGTRFDPW